MKNIRRLLLAVVFLLVLLSMSSCGKKAERSIESMFHKDAYLVAVVDSTDQDQTANLQKLIDLFPPTGFAKMMADSFNKGTKDARLTWENEISPVFKGKWKVAFSADLDFANMKGAPANFLLVGQFSEIKKLSALFKKMVDEKIGAWGNIEYEEKGGVEYWTSPLGESFWAIDGDVLVFAFTEADRKSALDRLNGRAEGFAKKKMIGNGFLRYYVGSKIMEPYKGLLGSMFGQRYEGLLESLKDVAFSLGAAEDGYKFSELVNLNMEKFKALNVNTAYKLSFVDKVNSKGLIFYNEGSSIRSSALGYLLPEEVDLSIEAAPISGEGSVVPEVDANIDAKTNASSSLDLTSLQTNVFQAFGAGKTESFEGGSIGNPAKKLGSASLLGREFSGLLRPYVKLFEIFLNVPYAIAVSDSDGFMPSLAFYFHLDKKDLEQAKNLVISFDGYSDEIIKELETKVPDGKGVGLLKKDVVAFNGGALHKLYVDWSILPKEELAKASEAWGFDASTLKAELYYGLMDDVFVIALQPGFTENYGKNVLSTDKDYREAVDRLEGNYGSKVAYFNIKPLLTLIDRIMILAKSGKSEAEVQDMDNEYNLYVKGYLAKIKYFIFSEAFEGEQQRIGGFVGIGK